ncbi:MAG: radical SAM family heme chaperone HemW [Steroidobacteraceae bacterium]|jgi:oxygen-independent coproporphyrinogen-3 oxidase|nr:radical SAM family heme chaperone HemW [Steroidobacteraceae bacterium]
MTPPLPPLALYVHFPWCVSKCPYCDFNSHAVRDALPEARYVAALLADLEAEVDADPALAAHSREVVSVFLGGGTPSLFSPESIGAVLEGARRRLPFAADVEVTMEANPGTIERGRFAGYAAAGVDRVSLGAQSFDAAALRALGRIHAADDTRRAAAELHAAGLDNFNLDLMYGLPGQDVARALADVEAALALQPAQVSHYHLTLEPGTPFAAQPPTGLPRDDDVEAMLDVAQARLADAGFARYEVSAYARPGRECRHNLNYWRFGDYLGIGAGAHGKLSARAADGALGIRRTVRLREPRRYLGQQPAAVTRTEVPAAQRPFEFMLNALRLVEGVESETFEQRAGLPLESIAPALQRLVARGLLHVGSGRIAPSALGLRFLNEVLVEFLPAETGT